jgi:hypothetical protein
MPTSGRVDVTGANYPGNAGRFVVPNDIRTRVVSLAGLTHLESPSR